MSDYLSGRRRQCVLLIQFRKSVDNDNNFFHLCRLDSQANGDLCAGTKQNTYVIKNFSNDANCLLETTRELKSGKLSIQIFQSYLCITMQRLCYFYLKFDNNKFEFETACLAKYSIWLNYLASFDFLIVRKLCGTYSSSCARTFRLNQWA